MSSYESSSPSLHMYVLCTKQGLNMTQHQWIFCLPIILLNQLMFHISMLLGLSLYKFEGITSVSRAFSIVIVVR